MYWKIKTTVPSENLVKKLQTYTVTDIGNPVSEKTDANGVAVFSDLPLGIYYVEETAGHSQITKKIESFVLSLPLTNAAGTEWLYERLKKVNQARSKTKSKYVKANLIDNVREYSNGESAFKFFTEKIKENALYLLDEPENSLSPKRQIELAQFIEEAARFYRCQFIISTHSPFLLALPFAKIYNLDLVPVTTSKWTELENVQTYFRFFEKHRQDFNNSCMDV